MTEGRRLKLALVATLTAHAMAWAVTLLFMWEFREDTARARTSLILLIPVVLTGIPVLCARAGGFSVVVWGCLLLLMMFSIVAAFTVGLFYLPAVAILVVAAIALMGVD